MTKLLEGPAPRVRAVPASAPFLDVFVDAVVEALWRADAPFSLSDALILLPNRRAAQGLIDAFAKRLGGAALLPAIRPLGDLDEDVDVWGADPIAFDIAPAIAPTRRRLELAVLARARFSAEQGRDDPARAIALADELTKLMDAAAAADAVDWSLLPNLVEEIDLAAHWKASAEFLEIITTYWPQRLAADALADPAARRTALLDALAARWREEPPTRPIIIAGSTGSIAATRRLMRVVAGLPQGVVVLPGLDADLDDAAWDVIGPQHPQAALKETLAHLGLKRGDVAALGSETAQGRARRVLIREALAPADATADWLKRLAAAGGAPMAQAAISGLSLLEAANAEEEASAIALLMREALETPDQTVALVTADNQLSRRVAEKLKRWNIAPNISHERPLRETTAGALIALVCDLARDSGDPITLAGVLKHDAASFGFTRAEFEAARAELEREVLRAPRRSETARDLPALCEKLRRAQPLAERIAAALAPMLALPSETDLTAFADTVTRCAEAIAQTSLEDGARIWAGRDGEAARKLLAEAIEEGQAFGPMPLAAAPRALLALMDGRVVAPLPGGDPRCAIWGPLEARVQRRDLMILGGLNEGVWPAPPPEDPFLSRVMRAKLGLPSPDARIGLAAHDFAQLACAPRVVLSRALKRGGAPSLASRWLWRLTTLLRGAGLTLEAPANVISWARALDVPQRVAPVSSPRPRPPTRLTRISATEVETLIRDPYAIYARRILGLEELNPVGHEPGARERGNAIHKAIELVGDHATLEALMRELDVQLAAYGFDHARRTGERARLRASAIAWLAWAGSREGAVHVEKRGEYLLKMGARLIARADRIEVGAHTAIVDFKTGAVPSNTQVKTGLAPQLTLETALLKHGAFDAPVPPARAVELVYWKFGGAKPEPRILNLETSVEAAGDAALAALEALMQDYADPDRPFLSSPRVQFMRKYETYDHLARRKEWADAEGEDE